MSGLPDDVRAFVEGNITTVMQLEVLLHLAAAPDETFEPTQLSARLGGSPDAVILGLEQLVSARLVERDEEELRYRYAPASPDLAAAVTSVAGTYATRKVAVVTLIFSKPSDDLSEFSRAFRLRKR